MRSVISVQMKLGSSDISTITFNPKSGDDIPQLLRGFMVILDKNFLTKKKYNER